MISCPYVIRSQDVQLLLHRKSEGKCDLVDFSPTVKMPLPCRPFHLRWLEPFLQTVQFSSVTQSCPALCHPMDPSTPGLPVHHQLPESTQPMSIESVMPSHYLILCCPLSLLPSIFPSIRVFSDESVLHIRWPKTVEAEKALAQKPRVLCLPTAEKEFIRILSG